MKATARIYGTPPVSRPAHTFPVGRSWPQLVYRLWDDAGRLLYIGWTEHFGLRMYTHRLSAAWWPDIASYQVDVFGTRAAASVAERSRIANENPVHNVQRTAAGWSAPCLIDESALTATLGIPKDVTPVRRQTLQKWFPE